MTRYVEMMPPGFKIPRSEPRTLSRTLILSYVDTDNANFVNYENEFVLPISRDAWEKLGRPESLTVTLEPSA